MALPPEPNWYHKKVDRVEKIWLLLSVLLVVIFFSAMMPIWHVIGKQNAVGETYRVDPNSFYEKTLEFVDRYKVGEENGIPIVEPPQGGDIYLYGVRFSWFPILKLRKGVTYRLHISALDVQHGFSLYPKQWNIQLYPGYEYVIEFTPTEEGVYYIVCNEYCGALHHQMVGKIIVTG